MNPVKTFFLIAGRYRLAILVGLAAIAVSAGNIQPQPPVRIPSYVAWTSDTVARATHGDAVRGLVIARRCERCHGSEGFSPDPQVPNLAGFDKLAMWKQMNDFRAGKRESPIMQAVANELSIQDYSDLAAYFF